jgi:hypothetical protein
VGCRRGTGAASKLSSSKTAGKGALPRRAHKALWEALGPLGKAEQDRVLQALAHRTHSNTLQRLSVATGLSLVQIHAQDRG